LPLGILTNFENFKIPSFSGVLLTATKILKFSFSKFYRYRHS
jgi:hypothetical protein